MNKLKYFSVFNEGRGRIEIKDNHVIAGDVNLPQTYDSKRLQKIGIDVDSFVLSPNNSYNFLNDVDDDISDSEVSKLVSPHVKKFNDFGFDPSKH